MITRKVIAGPAGHWYALIEGERDGTTALIGMPISIGETEAPPHPDDTGDFDGWCEITDPAPETDDEAIRAELNR